MDEIDYTPFLYQKSSDRPTPASKKEKKEKRRSTSEKGRGKTVFVVVVAVLLCFAIVFFCADFFTNGNLLKKIYAGIVKHEYVYYCVAIAYPTRETALAGVLLSEKNGGAGYLVADDNTYTVLSGIYTEKTDAQQIADKNTGSYVYTLRYKTSATDLANLTDEFVRETATVVTGLDAGTFSDAALSSHFNRYAVLFSSYQTDNEKEREYVSFVVSCLQSIESGVTERATVLFRVRHMLCATIYAAMDTFSVL